MNFRNMFCQNSQIAETAHGMRVLVVKWRIVETGSTMCKPVYAV